MPKRKRLFTPNKYKIKNAAKTDEKVEDETRERVTSARGKFKGALMDALEPAAQSDGSEFSPEESPMKSDRQQNQDQKESENEVKKNTCKSPTRQSYVLKLFDRSVDLSQFRDDSPLYPICRAWMVNQPKANYNEVSTSEAEPSADCVELPGPEGPPVAKIPPLIPQQRAADKNNINLNYREAPPPSRETLLRALMPRWAAVKQAWQDQITLKEARYESTQRVLNRINLEYPAR